MKHQGAAVSTGPEILGKRRFKVLARLAADWYWQLDENLCFIFYDGKNTSLSDISFKELAGTNRIDLLRNEFEPHADIDAHTHALENRESIDHIITLKRDGSTHFVRVVAEPDYDKNGRYCGYLGCSRDVTEHVVIEDRLAHFATHDDLTGVLNRREFERKLELLYRSIDTDKQAHSLCFIDLDKFKSVNDSAGHAAGDQLLRELAAIMRKHVNKNEFLGRLGGDEFCILLNADGHAAKRIADAIINAIVLYEFQWEGQLYKVGASIGITELDENIEGIDQLMLIADNACYTAKNNGRNQSYHSNECSVSQKLTLQRLTMIRHALKSNQYRLLLQRIVSADLSDPVERYEVLLRLECASGELLEPAEFLPMAKQYDLLRELDCWVVSNSIAALEELTLQSNAQAGTGSKVKPKAFSINLSASTLADQATLDRIAEIVYDTSVPANHLCFEINETTAIRNVSDLIQFMGELSAFGVEFALDDFGNGLTSIIDVQKLPIDYLKIDQALIAQVLSDSCGRTIVESIQMLGKRLGIKTVAEAVEDNASAEILRTMGFDYLQGFAVSNLIGLPELFNGSNEHAEVNKFSYVPKTRVKFRV